MLLRSLLLDSATRLSSIVSRLSRNNRLALIFSPAYAQAEVNGTAYATSEKVDFRPLIQPPSEEQLLTSTLWPEYVPSSQKRNMNHTEVLSPGLRNCTDTGMR